MRIFYLISYLLFIPFLSIGQGIIVNEMSNGTSGSKEFVEFLVVGSQAQPTGNIDLTGWVFDDNNGDFEGSSTTGVAGGHYKLTSHFSSIPIGSIIVIYNSSDLNSNLPADDPFDSNGDLVYVLPINSLFLERCTTNPSSTNGPSYLGCTYTSLTTQTWNSVGMRNSGDAVQVRKPDYSFYHGFCYGDITLPYPNFPNGNISFNVRTGSGTGRNYYLDCGDWTLETSYLFGDASSDTPGLPNTLNNLSMIENIRQGLFDYSDPNNLSNCSTILNLGSIDLNFDLNEFDLKLSWTSDVDFDYYNILSSDDGFNFDKIDKTEFKNITLNSFIGYKYFKVVGFIDGKIYDSNIIFVSGADLNQLIYPNPTFDKIYINKNLDLHQVKIYNSIGQLIRVTYDHEVNLKGLSNFVIIEIINLYGFSNYKKILITK